jgi:hypothetical protein
MPRKKHSKRRRLQRVTIKAERHEEPDWDRFAWALLQHARIVSARQTKAKRPNQRPTP